MKQVLSPLTYLFCFRVVGAFTTLAPFPTTTAITKQRHPLVHYKKTNKNNNKELLDLSAAVSPLEIDQDKSDEEILFIIETILKNSLVADENISDTNLLELVEACEKKLATRNDYIYREGENGHVYFIKEGSCKVLGDGKEAPYPYEYREILPGHLFAYGDGKGEKSAIVTSETLIYYQIQEDIVRKVLGKSIIQQVYDQDSISNPIDEKNDQVSTSQSSETSKTPSFADAKDTHFTLFSTNRFWLWSDHDGSILQPTLLREIALNTLVTTMLVLFIRIVTGETLFSEIDDTQPMLQILGYVKGNPEIWEKQVEFTTLISFVFFYHSFSFWQSIRDLMHKVDTEISTFLFLIRTNLNRDEFGDLTSESEEFLEDIRKSISTDRTSDYNSDAHLEKVLFRINEAMTTKVLSTDSTTKTMMLQKIVDIRATSNLLSTKMHERIPFGYVKFVQIVVDLFLLVAPFALYIDLQEYSIIAVCMLTLLYSGLNTMAKMFLYPLDSVDIPLDTIIDSNLGIFLLICCISLELNHLGVLSFSYN